MATGRKRKTSTKKSNLTRQRRGDFSLNMRSAYGREGERRRGSRERIGRSNKKSGTLRRESIKTRLGYASGNYQRYTTGEKRENEKKWIQRERNRKQREGGEKVSHKDTAKRIVERLSNK